MEKIKVDIDEIQRLSDVINSKNTGIDDTVKCLVKEIKKSQDYWTGKGANRTRSNISKLETINLERSKVLRNYQSFLLQSVSLGYDESEKINVNLAKAFK